MLAGLEQRVLLDAFSGYVSAVEGVVNDGKEATVYRCRITAETCTYAIRFASGETATLVTMVPLTMRSGDQTAGGSAAQLIVEQHNAERMIVLILAPYRFADQ